MPASSWIPYANKGRPAVHRFVVEQCHKIPIPTLLKGMSLGQQQIQVGPLTATVYLSDRGPSYLHIGNRQFELRSIPVHFGGSYWLYDARSPENYVGISSSIQKGTSAAGIRWT
jgi:hypothetical protein